MINFKYSFSRDFLIDFEHKFITNIVSSKANLLINTCADEKDQRLPELEFLLSPKMLRRIIYCTPRNSKKLVGFIYKLLPVLADRYNPTTIYKNAIIDFSIADTSIVNRQNRTLVENYRKHLLLELYRLKKEWKSDSCNYFIKMINSDPKASIVKNTVHIIRELSCGNDRYIKEHSGDIFCNWVNGFYKVFDYNFVSSQYGYKIIEASGLTVCPYCNAEEINTILGNKKHRPDIDHYLPKSKYPFFSASLFNYIPAGNACNQSFKKEMDLMNGYLNPLVAGIESENLFKISYEPVSDLTSIAFEKIDRFEGNRELFEINSVYDSPRFKNKYKSLRDIYIMLKQIKNGEDIKKDSNLMSTFFDLKPTSTVRNKCGKKFEIEAINHIIKNN